MGEEGGGVITTEIRAELLRLYEQSRKAHDPDNPASLVDANESWTLLTRALVRHCPALLDALAAAEADRDRLRRVLTDIAVNGSGEEARRAQDALSPAAQQGDG
jgi:hypothetical protein